jgi:putative redox protein
MQHPVSTRIEWENQRIRMSEQRTPSVVVVHASAGGLRTEIEVRGHRSIADEPSNAGGTDEGPTPYELLSAALGACVAMTIRLYADRKGWPVEGVTVRLRHSKVWEKDCQDCDEAPVGVDRIERKIELQGPLTDEQRTRILAIADRCPVKQTLERGIRIVAAELASPA